MIDSLPPKMGSLSESPYNFPRLVPTLEWVCSRTSNGRKRGTSFRQHSPPFLFLDVSSRFFPIDGSARPTFLALPRKNPQKPLRNMKGQPYSKANRNRSGRFRNLLL